MQMPTSAADASTTPAVPTLLLIESLDDLAGHPQWTSPAAIAVAHVERGLPLAIALALSRRLAALLALVADPLWALFRVWQSRLSEDRQLDAGLALMVLVARAPLTGRAFDPRQIIGTVLLAEEHREPDRRPQKSPPAIASPGEESAGNARHSDIGRKLFPFAE